MIQRSAIVFVSMLALSASPAAAPFLPTDEAMVLEQLPVRSAVEDGDLMRLKAEAAAAPASIEAASALAGAYYRISRREGDPRYLGYAQAALAPWWEDADAPTQVLIARARILQSNHEFDRALADLGKAIAREPGNANAILIRATVETVQGKYAAARSTCSSLQGLSQDLYVLGCLASVEAVAGNSTLAKAALLASLERGGEISPELRGWFESLLGEIAERLGSTGVEAHFQAALAADPRDLYTIGVYCDWLLDQGRAADVIPLVEREKRVDGLLLRLAIAQKQLKLPEAEASIAALRARFEASRARGDTVHRREEARFQLLLGNDAQAALRLALENWNVQKEPTDLRILAEAARAAGDAKALDTIRRWLADTRLEYRAVAEMVQ
ncbi:MAG: hypothetical protein ACKVP5_00915 [Aestuariivirga sp.]